MYLLPPEPGLGTPEERKHSKVEVVRYGGRCGRLLRGRNIDGHVVYRKDGRRSQKKKFRVKRTSPVKILIQRKK